MPCVRRNDANVSLCVRCNDATFLGQALAGSLSHRFGSWLSGLIVFDFIAEHDGVVTRLDGHLGHGEFDCRDDVGEVYGRERRTRDGRAAAVKVGDGSDRAGMVALAEVLRQIGVPAGDLVTVATKSVLGHGRPVGEVRAVPLR